MIIPSQGLVYDLSSTTLEVQLQQRTSNSWNEFGGVKALIPLAVTELVSDGVIGVVLVHPDALSLPRATAAGNGRPWFLRDRPILGRWLSS